MPITLSSSDLARVRDAQNLLLSPLSHTGTDWPALACEAVRLLIGADHATFYSAYPSPTVLHTTLDEAAVTDYVETFATFDVATPRALQLGRAVGHVLDVVAAEEFYESPLYHEYAVPRRIYDPMLLHARPEPELSVWITAPEAAPLGAKEIERRRQLLELASPAFAAGIASFLRLGSQRAALGRVLDGIGTPLLLCDTRGRPVHENAALRRFLAAEHERERVSAALAQIAADVGRNLRRPDCAGSEPATGTTAVIRTESAVLRVTATTCEDGALGPEPLLVLQLHVESTSLPALPDVRSRFGLTRREGEVCMLLARRLTNREIAEELSISPHTAERHTEKVLQKLAIHSRADVRTRLERH